MKDKQIAIIGLGKMGLGLAAHLAEQGIDVRGFNKDTAVHDRAEKLGVKTFSSEAELLESLDGEKLIWLMVPHQAIDSVLETIRLHLAAGDTIIDGGNSPFQKSKERAAGLAETGVRFLDVGVSGGPSGARNGACLMIGGEMALYEKLHWLWTALAAREAFGYFGPAGSGHYVKMVHNGIEYGMMQAIAEGFALMKNSPDFPDLDLQEIARVYNQQSVISSRLIGWLESGLQKHGLELHGISGTAKHSGEGQWTIDEAKRQNYSAPVIEAALQFRKDSADTPSFTGQVVSVLRNEFGGHDVAQN